MDDCLRNIPRFTLPLMLSLLLLCWFIQVTLPADVGRLVLPCVWPLALAADDEAEADRWFNIRLKPYLPFLNKQLLTSTTTLGASCQPFSKLYVHVVHYCSHGGETYGLMVRELGLE